MPYPLPPFLTAEGIECAVRSLVESREALEPRLHVEFPGFTDGFSLIVGRIDAYDWFREVADQAEVDVTLDVGHLLSWRYLRGGSGPSLFEGLDRLPLERCREIHLSGCAVLGGRLLDLHHGVLMDEQIELLARLIDRCPKLVGITYEDPAVDTMGQLSHRARRNVGRLRDMVDRWAR